MSSRSAVDDHFGLVVEQKAEEKLRRALQILKDSGIGFIVEGGWAMAAAGSPTPSVDLDIMFRAEEYEKLRAHILAATDIQIETDSGLQTLGIDWRFSDDPNRLFTKPDQFYVPDDFLRNRIQSGAIHTVGGTLYVRIPSYGALGIMKMKAFHDRRLQWEASREPQKLASLSRDDGKAVTERTTAYWERKAGKDLYDIAFLIRNHGAEVNGLLNDTPFDKSILAALHDPPAPLVAFANEMAKRSRVKIHDPTQLHRP